MQDRDTITNDSNILLEYSYKASDDQRFIVVKGSLSAHCCFGYTVIDTAAGKQEYGDYWKRTMCETFEELEAQTICVVLNRVLGVLGVKNSEPITVKSNEALVATEKETAKNFTEALDEFTQAVQRAKGDVK